MLPTTRIGPDLSRTVSKHHVSKPTQDVNRKHRPVRAAFAPVTARVAAKANVAPTRTSLDHGIATPALEAVDPSVVDLQHQTVSPSISASSQSNLSNSTSTNSLSGSDSELALLLNGADLSRPGTTTINIGSIPISVPVAYIEVPAAECSEGQQEEQQQEPIPAEAAMPVAAVAAADAAQPEPAAAPPPTKLDASSAEFYPNAYLAAAAATALAAQSISSSSAAHSSSSEGQHESAADDQQQPVESTPEQQQSQQAVMEQQQQQMQAWQHWQQQQQWQQPMPMPVPMFFPVPMPMAPYMMPAAYQYAWQQQQWHQHQLHMQQMHMQQQQVVPPAAPAAAPHEGSSRAEDVVPAGAPLSPAPSLPADTSSLMSVPSAHNWPMAHSSGAYSSRPGSSASSIVSAFAGSSRSRAQQERLRDAGTVTVSALSCVKDAAGALAKVVSRHGSCLLLSLARPGDVPAQATHVAAKSLAVARFYVNAHMAAEGSAGVDAAAVLSGAEPAAAAPAAAEASQSTDEVVFMPYHRSGSSSSRAADVDPPLGFMVAKASSQDLPVLLPPPVGIPACMQDRQGQQQQQQAKDEVAGAVHAYQSAAPLLKAGANTDVNKLSNAIIHNILGCNHVALQLAGAAACHVAMKALIKARARLQRKFAADIVATASFANEDTSSSIGRSTVFLRLDVMRSNILQQLMEAGAAASTAVSRTVSEVGEVLTAQQQPAGAVA